MPSLSTLISLINRYGKIIKQDIIVHYYIFFLLHSMYLIYIAKMYIS